MSECYQCFGNDVIWTLFISLGLQIFIFLDPEINHMYLQTSIKAGHNNMIPKQKIMNDLLRPGFHYVIRIKEILVREDHNAKSSCYHCTVRSSITIKGFHSRDLCTKVS